MQEDGDVEFWSSKIGFNFPPRNIILNMDNEVVSIEISFALQIQ